MGAKGAEHRRRGTVWEEGCSMGARRTEHVRRDIGVGDRQASVWEEGHSVGDSRQYGFWRATGWEKGHSEGDRQASLWKEGHSVGEATSRLTDKPPTAPDKISLTPDSSSSLLS